LPIASGTRIVTVSSGVANQGKIEFDNLQSERVYKPMFGAYSQSKLADLIFQLELQRRLTAAGSPILSTGAHPGYALTNLQTSGSAGVVPLSFRLVEIILKPLASQDAAHGALPTLFAATSPKATPGGYYGPNGFQELKGYPVPARIAPAAKDLSLAKRLWTETEHLTGIAFELRPEPTDVRAGLRPVASRQGSVPQKISNEKLCVVGATWRPRRRTTRISLQQPASLPSTFLKPR
jgi:NAD(P)-dependent dehydrogenase (short-subunit alcohol dehydrogenase family)